MGTMWDSINPGRKSVNSRALALWTPHGQYTYGEVSQIVAELRQRLGFLGVISGSRVLVTAERDAESVFCILALESMECTQLAVSPDYPVERINADVAQTRSDYCLIKNAYWKVNHAHLANFEFLGGVSAEFALLKTVKAENGIPVLGRDGRPLSFIARSSGSTGVPKYVCLSQGSKVARLESHIATYELENKAVLLTSTPLHHTLSQRAIHAALSLGSAVAILDRYSPTRWRECAIASGAEFSAVVASQLRTILGQGPVLARDGFRIKTLVSSSAPLNFEEKVSYVQHCDFKLHECYGTSEMATATDICLSSNLSSAQSVGWAVRGARVTVRNLTSALDRASRERGEVCIQSKQGFDGYLDADGRLPELWDLAGDFHTGDLGEIGEDGSLQFFGRTVEMLNVGGSNVYPIEIENVGARFPGVEEVVVAGYPHPTLGEVPIMFLRTGPGFEGVPRIMRFLRKSLEAFQLPQDIRVVDEVPLTSAGKTDRKALLASVSE